MAQGRTVSANFLTEKDRKIIQICLEVGNTIIELINDSNERKRFKDTFSKISYTRDAGAGQGGGKLQRDALCTRGIQGKAPYSNRNLRWHPLIASKQPVPHAKEIESVEIEGEEEAQTLVFIVLQEGERVAYPASRVHELPERYAVLPKHWQPHIERLKFCNDTLWTQNSCIITGYEACDWQDAVEAFAVLAISAATNFFNLKFEEVFMCVVETLQKQTTLLEMKLPRENFPKNEDDISRCPLCKVSVSASPANLPERKRDERWKPDWSANKRGEGEDASMQLMHIEPLTEIEIRHTAKNVRYGHRWCNVAMTDHSIEETLDFMEYIVKAHHRLK